MTDERWNPTPPGWKPIPTPTPRARGKQLWRLEHESRVVSCELRDDRTIGAGFEIIIRHDDEIMIGRRCIGEAEAHYYANAFRQDYARSGWTEPQ
jgi:hypothetical protein